MTARSTPSCFHPGPRGRAAGATSGPPRLRRRARPGGGGAAKRADLAAESGSLLNFYVLVAAPVAALSKGKTLLKESGRGSSGRLCRTLLFGCYVRASVPKQELPVENRALHSVDSRVQANSLVLKGAVLCRVNMSDPMPGTWPMRPKEVK